MNIKNAKVVLKHLIAQKNSASAARLNMNFWGDKFQKFMLKDSALRTPVCKTQSCLAGETTIALGAARILKGGGLKLSRKITAEFGMAAFPEVAAHLLDLDPNEWRRLFYLKSFGYTDEMGYRIGWPYRFEQAYLDARTPKQRMTATVNRFRFFIETDGTDVEQS